MTAPDLSTCSTLMPLPRLPIDGHRATVAVFDAGDHLEAYLAPVGLQGIATALAGDGEVAAWDALGQPLEGGKLLPATHLPEAGEALDGAPRTSLPASLRAGPRSLLAAGHEWVLCVEDGMHGVVFARRPSVVVRAVHGLLTQLLRDAGWSTRLDPVVVGMLARPSQLGPHLLSLDLSEAALRLQSPSSTRLLRLDRRGIWRPQS